MQGDTEKKYTLEELKDICFKKHWDQLPLYARIVTFRMSIRLVRTLYPTKITPLHVTLISLAVAFGAACSFSAGGVFFFLLGAVLLEFYYVLDCVDGQLARLRGSCTKL